MTGYEYETWKNGASKSEVHGKIENNFGRTKACIDEIQTSLKPHYGESAIATGSRLTNKEVCICSPDACVNMVMLNLSVDISVDVSDSNSPLTLNAGAVMAVSKSGNVFNLADGTREYSGVIGRQYYADDVLRKYMNYAVSFSWDDNGSLYMKFTWGKELYGDYVTSVICKLADSIRWEAIA